MTDLGATTQFSFGTGPGGVAGESIVNAATGQPGAGVLAGTLGASSSYNQFTLTMWLNISTAAVSNYRVLELAPGSPPTTGSADGTILFFGVNGTANGLQFYVNGNNPGDSTVITSGIVWNNGGTLGSLAANKWYFTAITYDISSGAVVYSGDQTDVAVSAATLSDVAGGALNLNSATSTALLDRFTSGRNFPGQIDDVGLYSGVLSQAQIQAIQASSVPEPGTLTLAGLGMAGLITMIRRRKI